MSLSNKSDIEDPNIFIPDAKGWLPKGPYGPSIWTEPGGTIMVQRIEPGDLTPEEAREVADVLYAAAEYSEKGRITGFRELPKKPVCPYCGGYGGAHYKDCPTWVWDK